MRDGAMWDSEDTAAQPLRRRGDSPSIRHPHVADALRRSSDYYPALHESWARSVGDLLAPSMHTEHADAHRRWRSQWMEAAPTTADVGAASPHTGRVARSASTLPQARGEQREVASQSEPLGTLQQHRLIEKLNRLIASDNVEAGTALSLLAAVEDMLSRGPPIRPLARDESTTTRPISPPRTAVATQADAPTPNPVTHHRNADLKVELDDVPNPALPPLQGASPRRLTSPPAAPVRRTTSGVPPPVTPQQADPVAYSMEWWSAYYRWWYAQQCLTTPVVTDDRSGAARSQYVEHVAPGPDKTKRTAEAPRGIAYTPPRRPMGNLSNDMQEPEAIVGSLSPLTPDADAIDDHSQRVAGSIVRAAERALEGLRIHSAGDMRSVDEDEEWGVDVTQRRPPRLAAVDQTSSRGGYAARMRERTPRSPKRWSSSAAVRADRKKTKA